MYRPNQHFLVLLNSDGTGSVRQFNNEKDALDAYYASPYDSAFVYLYTQPVKSLAEGEESDPPLFDFTTVFTDIQNATANKNINHPQFDSFYSLFESVNPCAGAPSFPRPTSIGSGPEIDPNWDAWMTFCKLKPNCPECTSGTNTPFGTVTSDATQGEERLDFSRTLRTVTIRGIERANGMGGFYTEYTTKYPQGWLEEINGEDSIQRNYIVKGLDPSLGPNSFVDMHLSTILINITRTRHIYDSEGGLIQILESGVPQPSDNIYESFRPLIQPQIGDTPVEFFGKPVGAPAGSGFPQSYNVDGVIYSGTWFPEMVSNGIGPVNEVAWSFQPNQPDQPPPPAGSILVEARNPNSDESTYIPDTRVYYPTRVEDTQNVNIDINGTSVKVGERTRYGLNNRGVIAYGEFGLNEYIAQGELIYTDTNYNYFSDGEGGYTVEGIVCPTEGTVVSIGKEPITISTMCGFGQIGERDYQAIADGACGTYRIYGASYYVNMGNVFAVCPYVNEYGVTVERTYASTNDGNFTEYDQLPQYYDWYGIDDDTGLSYQGPFDTPLPEGYENNIESGDGYGEAQIYDEAGLPITYDSYDPVSGDVQFSAGQSNTPQDGDWLRNQYGKIVYLTRTPRLVEVELPAGFRTSTLTTVDSMGSRPTGATRIKVQVGWNYTGRKRYKASLNMYVNEASFTGSQDLPVGKNPINPNTPSGERDNIAILQNDELCNFNNLNEAGPKTFYEAIDTGQNGFAKWRFKNNTNWYVVSNGDGTARLQKAN